MTNNTDSESDAAGYSEDITIEEGEDIPVDYIVSNEFERYPASGVRGGLQPRGQFHLDFILEYTNDPSTEIREVRGGVAGPLKERKPEPRLIREKKTGVVLDQNAAFTTGIWIISSVLQVPEQTVAEAIIDRFDLHDQIQTPMHDQNDSTNGENNG